MLNRVEVKAVNPDQVLPNPVGLGRAASMGVFEDFQKKIKERRDELKTQQALADETGLSQSTISRVLNGGGLKGTDMAEAIDRLGGKIVWLDEQRETTREVAWVRPRKSLSVQDSPENPDATLYATRPPRRVFSCREPRSLLGLPCPREIGRPKLTLFRVFMLACLPDLA